MILCVWIFFFFLNIVKVALHFYVLAYHCFTDWEQHADVADDGRGRGPIVNFSTFFLINIWQVSFFSPRHSWILTYWHCFTEWEQHAGHAADEWEGIGAPSSTFSTFLY